MSDPFIGEIKLFPFAYAPQGWALCNGAVLPIQSYAALYSLLGTSFGGDGKTTFALPNFNGRVAVYAPNLTSGGIGGAETVALTPATIPPHQHVLNAVTVTATATNATNMMLATAGESTAAPGARPIYGTGAVDAFLAADTVDMVGAGAAHPNMQPYLVLNYCIATQGLYPSRE
ncbi:MULTISPECIES: phage tail protein [Sphingomonas]|uniref:phage tail protein n=1 Tax=Sphingomonas TaxID=13687 RepID=UPI000833F0CD|nr:tail fiber protein [Sphingomonas sp. CCH10-B3]